jgi:hypothetical protein
MGGVIRFPRVRRGLSEPPTPTADVSAAVVILPAIRIERACAAPPGAETKTTKSRAGRKRRKRLTSPSPAS